MAATMTATFNGSDGSVTVKAHEVPAGYHIYRVYPPVEWDDGTLTGHDYTDDDPTQIMADVLAPLGTTVRYALRTSPTGPSLIEASLVTPSNKAYLRHLFYPRLAVPIRVVAFDDKRPARLTLYAVSGQRNGMASYDVRGGRDATLRIAVDGKAERDALDVLIADGCPVSLAMCNALGNNPGIFAVGDVSFTRWGKGARWLVELALTEVDKPIVLGVLADSDIPQPTYGDADALLGASGTYRHAMDRWRWYYESGL